MFAQLTSLTLSSSSPTELLDDFVDQVIGLNLQGGISNSFDVNLGAVLQALEDSHENNDTAALNAMNAFVNSVHAQRGTKLTDAQADALLSMAQEIIGALGG